MLCFLSTGIFAQTVFEDWVQKTGSQNYFLKSTVKTDSYRNVFQAGATISPSGDYDVILTKYNPRGEEVWTKTYDDAGYNDAAVDIYIDASHNVYIAGTTFNPANSGYQVLVLKYNSGGTLLWDETYSYPSSLYNVATSITGEGNQIFIGGVTYNLQTGADFLALAYGSDGNMAWDYSWDNVSLDDGVTNIYKSGNSISLAGGSEINPNKWQYAIINLRPYDGAFLAQRLSGGSADGIDRISDIAKDPAGNIYVTGGSANLNSGYDFRTLKLDTSLAIVWSKTYNSSGHLNDVANGLAVDNSGNVYVTGYSETTENGTDYTTLKYEPSGGQVWAKTYNGKDNGADTAKVIVLDENQLPVITGVSSIIGSQDFYTIKYDAQGNEVWGMDYNGTSNGNDNPFGIAVDNDGAIIVAGQSYIGDSYRYVSVKYSEHTITNPPDEETIPSAGYFTKNSGQLQTTNGSSSSNVKYIANGDYPKVYVQNDKLSYVFAAIDSTANDTVHRIDMTLTSRQKEPKMRAMDKMDFYQNFYLPTVPDGKRERVPSYKKLIRMDAWNDIDFMLSHNAKGLKYYLICKPGSNPADIGWEYTGATSVSVNGSGDLVVASSIGSMAMPRGEAYEVTSTGARIDKSWQPAFQVSGTDVSLSIGSYNSANTLVIEIDRGETQGGGGGGPYGNLLWSSYYGGVYSTVFQDVKTNIHGDIYITGALSYNSFPITPGLTIVNQYNNWQDGITFKLSSNLVPIWATYFGGSQNDGPTSIAITPSGGTIYIAGSTSSEDMVIEDGNGLYYSDANNVQNVPSTGNEAFIATFKDGGFLIWSTYYGGELNEIIWDIALDNNSNLYCVGERSESTENFIRPGSANNTEGESMILMFNAGFQRKWATAYNATKFNSITADNEGRIYICGQNEEPNSTILNADSNFPNTTSYHGDSDGYILSFDENGQPMYAFYYGGNCRSSCLSIEADDDNNIYIAGISYSALGSFCNSNYSLPILGGFNASGNSREVFLLKLSDYIGGDADIVRAGYFGGGGREGYYYPTAIYVDLAVASDGSFGLTTVTTSNGVTNVPGIQTPNFQPQEYYVEPYSGIGSSDVALAYFNSDFDLKWSTYFGGDRSEKPTSITIDEPRSRLYLIGRQATNNLNSNVNIFFPLKEFDTTVGSNDYFQESPANSGNDQNPSFAALFDISGTLTGLKSSDEANSELKMYPNPVSANTLNVLSNYFGFWHYEVFDLMGRKIDSGSCKRNQVEINVRDYSNGIYIVKAISHESFQTAKFIVER